MSDRKQWVEPTIKMSLTAETEQSEGNGSDSGTLNNSFGEPPISFPF
jgi:hypothetical protein